MSTFNFAAIQGSIADTVDLPRPDTSATAISSVEGTTSKRPLPCVADSGRISFGAAMRLPVQK